jgi:type IV secretory pathway VirB10-like protein
LRSVDSGILLPPGTRLIARVDAAATSALQTPVVASIEYNYERDGAIAVPAGSKVIGEVRQASTDGYVDVRFHTLQTPDGRPITIDATATSLDLKPLKGTVTGKNTGKRILSRTLSGVGTIAAYVVGGGGGLSGAVTGETLLRDRVAGNIALAGEEQLRNAAYMQNIAVTLPANMRFYVVLQKSTASPSPSVSSASDVSVPRPQAELPTVQELRELMDLRREINRMYQESNGNPVGPHR